MMTTFLELLIKRLWWKHHRDTAQKLCFQPHIQSFVLGVESASPLPPPSLILDQCFFWNQGYSFVWPTSEVQSAQRDVMLAGHEHGEQAFTGRQFQAELQDCVTAVFKFWLSHFSINALQLRIYDVCLFSLSSFMFVWRSASVRRV